MPLNPDAFLKPYKERRYKGPVGTRRNFYAPKPRKEESAEPKEQPEEQHYWTVEQWEDWATNEFYNNPDTILPEWFVKEMQEEEKE